MAKVITHSYPMHMYIQYLYMQVYTWIHGYAYTYLYPYAHIKTYLHTYKQHVQLHY